MYTIFPVRSYIDNVCTDGSGTHFKTSNNKYKVDLNRAFEKIILKNHIEINNEILNSLRKTFSSTKVIFIKNIKETKAIQNFRNILNYIES